MNKDGGHTIHLGNYMLKLRQNHPLILVVCLRPNNRGNAIDVHNHCSRCP